MARYQSGHVLEAHGAFHVRYFAIEIVDGKPQRVQRSKRLSTKDNQHHSLTCKAVKQLAATEMESQQRERSDAAGRCHCDFWGTIYLPHGARSTVRTGCKPLCSRSRNSCCSRRDKRTTDGSFMSQL
jgi:hypothetical protein